VGVSRDRARRVGLRGAVALSGVSLTLLAGCSAETTGQLKRLGLPEAGTVQAPSIGDLWIGTWIAAGSIGIAVYALVIWAALRYRSNHNDMPKQNRYNLPMEIFYTVAPFVVIGVLFYYTVLAQNVVQKNPTPDLTVDVVGQKWAWTFNYESAGVPSVGTDVWETGTINQWSTLYLPVNKTVRFNLSSPDVNHSFWVPVFYEKMDVIPGRDNHFTVTPNREGVFRGKCAELCGTYHSAMLFDVHVVSEAEYEAHLKTLADRGQTGQAKGSQIPVPTGELGNTGIPDELTPAAAQQGGTR
jgi:cytochrome c oxidase subunit 2